MAARSPNGGPGSGPLVLEGQRSATPLCEDGPKGLRHLTSTGYVRPRCKRRNCARCWSLRSRELARVLVLDAREDAPTHCLTLTTSDPETTPAAIRRGTENVVRRLRRRFGRLEYFAAVEFTTGKARRSGGQRRLHLHLLLKVGEGFDVVEAERLVRDTWSGSTGAVVVEVAALVSPGAALGYLGLHHRKPEQAPPREWRGMTERPSRGYYHRPVRELREQAISELRVEAIAWKLGLPAGLAALEVAAAGESKLVRVREGVVLEPLGELVPRPRRGGGERDGATFATSRLQPGSVPEEEREESGRGVR